MDKMQVTVNDAACVLGMDFRVLRRWLRLGSCPFGVYMPPESGGRDGHYYINRARLEIYISGKDMLAVCPHSGKMLFSVGA